MTLCSLVSIDSLSFFFDLRYMNDPKMGPAREKVLADYIVNKGIRQVTQFIKAFLAFQVSKH